VLQSQPDPTVVDGDYYLDVRSPTAARLFYLPKYSPDLNPIEQFFAKFKHWLRKAAQRPFTMLSLLDTVSAAYNLLWPIATDLVRLNAAGFVEALYPIDRRADAHPNWAAA
jgi:DDE superfamily endonuclease